MHAGMIRHQGPANTGTGVGGGGRFDRVRGASRARSDAGRRKRGRRFPTTTVGSSPVLSTNVWHLRPEFRNRRLPVISTGSAAGASHLLSSRPGCHAVCPPNRAAQTWASAR